MTSKYLKIKTLGHIKINFNMVLTCPLVSRNANGMAKSADHDQDSPSGSNRSSVIWVYIAQTCVGIFRIITVILGQHKMSRLMTKPTIRLCPVKAQISLGIRPVWSESSVCMKKALILSIERTAKTDQTGRMPRLRQVWSESSLGTQPLCWFCHDAAQM